MNKHDKQQLIELIKSLYSQCCSGYGMSPATFKSYFRDFTDIAKLKYEKKWRDLCFSVAGNEAQEYLQLHDRNLLIYNGMSIKRWHPESITKEDVIKAIRASYHPLTPSTIQHNKKLRCKLTNADIVKFAAEFPYNVHDDDGYYKLPNIYWLQLLNKKDTSLAKLAKLNTPLKWIKYLGIAQYFLDRPGIHIVAESLTKLLKDQNAPQEVLDYAKKIRDYQSRYTNANPKIGWETKKAVMLSEDSNEDAEFETYLKMKGHRWHKEWNCNLKHEQHYREGLMALSECLITKYILKENTI